MEVLLRVASRQVVGGSVVLAVVSAAELSLEAQPKVVVA
jgi:hypothetical protein